MIIEWNQHIFHPDSERFPFHERAVYTPKVPDTDDPLQDYEARMQAEGIDRAVLVHPEPYGDDHRLVLDCLEREPELFLGTTLLYPKDDDAPAKLADLVAQQPKLISTRFHAHRGKGAVSRFLRRRQCAGVVGEGRGARFDHRTAHRP